MSPSKATFIITTSAKAFFLVTFLMAQRSMAQPSATFQSMGDLPGGHAWSVASGTAADGSVVVGSSSSAHGYEPSRWTADEGLIGLGDLWGVGVLDGAATSVSSDGKVVVGWSRSRADPIYNEAFRWTSDGGMFGLGSLPGGSQGSNAFDVSADGSVIVGKAYNSLGGAAAFRWAVGEGLVPIGYLTTEPFSSTALGVSADGLVVVGSSYSASGIEAFRWRATDGMVGLGDLPGGIFESKALDVSANGRVVVGFGSTLYGQRAFRWTRQRGMVELGVPDSGFESNALAVSSNGAVIVGAGGTGGSTFFEAFIWDNVNGIRLIKSVLEDDFGLDLSSWRLSAATDVSPDGSTIVGHGTSPDGEYQGWIAFVPHHIAKAQHREEEHKGVRRRN